MKIGTKLLGGFLSVAVIVALVGAIGLASLRTLDKADTFLYEKTAVPLSDLALLMDHYGKIRVALRDMLNLEGADGKAAADTIKENVAAVDKEIADYRLTLIDEADAKLYAVLQAAWSEYRSIAERMLALDLAGKDAEAMAFMYSAETRKSVAELGRILEETIHLNIETSKRISDGNTALTNRTTVIMVVCIVAAFIASLLLGGLLSRSIVLPLGKAVDIAGAIAVGDLRVQVEAAYLRRKDEIGVLARSIDTMAKGLLDVVVSVTSSANGVASGSS